VLTLRGQLNIEIGEFDKARDLLARALEANTRRGVPTDLCVRALTGISWIETETGAYDAALDDARQALALLDQQEQPDAADVANAHQLITQSLAGKGERKDIETLLRANLARAEAALGRGDEYIADGWLQLAVFEKMPNAKEPRAAAVLAAFSEARIATGAATDALASARMAVEFAALFSVRPFATRHLVVCTRSIASRVR
jgi:tetratricopeptide (TPR) repeat protein